MQACAEPQPLVLVPWTYMSVCMKLRVLTSGLSA